LADSNLPAAEVESDPGVFHAEGLAYLTDSGFPVDWAQNASAANSGTDAISDRTKTVVASGYTPRPPDEFEEYFDSAPIAHLAEPAAVSPYAGPNADPGTSTPGAASTAGPDTLTPALAPTARADTSTPAAAPLASAKGAEPTKS
jgi:hypothetical protein